MRGVLALLLVLALLPARAAEPDATEQALRAAVQAAEGAPGPQGQQLLEALAALGDHLAAQGRLREAVAQWQLTLERAEALRGPRHPDVAAALDRLGGLHQRLGEHAQGVALHERSVALLEQIHGPEHVDVATGLSNLGVALRAAGRLDDAVPVFERALRIFEARLGPEHPQVAIALNNAAVLQMSLAHYPQALALQERSAAIIEKRLGPDHPDVAVSLANRAALNDLAGDFEAAVPLYRRSVAILEAAQGADSASLASVLSNFGGALQRTGRVDEALEVQRRSLAIRERRLGADHPDVAYSLNNLAQLHVLRGELATALPLAQRSLAIFEARFGADHPRTANALSNVGAMHFAFGQAAEAAALEQRALAALEARLDADHPEIATSLSNLAAYRQKLGDDTQAQALFERSLAMRERRLGPRHMLVAYALNNLAAVHLSAGRVEQALPLLARSRAIVEGLPAPDDQAVAAGLNNEAVALMLAGESERAVEAFQRAILRAQAGAGAREVLWKAQSGLGVVHARAGRPELAIVWGKEAVNTLQGLRGEISGVERGLQSSYLQSRRSVYDQLADLLIAQGRLDEAQQVLQMLKEQELHESLQRAEPDDPRRTRIELTGLERERFARYYALRDQQAALGAERQALQRKARAQPLAAADAARLKQIVDELMPVAEQAMGAFFAQLERDMAGLAPPGTQIGREASRLRQAVDRLALQEPDAAAVGVQYLVTEQRLSIVLSLPGTPPIAVQQPIGRQALYRRIAELTAQLRQPRADPALYRAGLRELHAWLIAPIAADLRRFGARTLMLSLDDQLRLIPFAALLDAAGRHLVQDYTLALYNEAARQALEKPAGAPWRVAAMGLSEPVEDLPALPAVPQELAAVVRAPGTPGQAWLNREFDRPRLVATLAAPAYNVLHIASHFVFQPGLPGESRLYLGDKSRLTLADIARADLKFGRFELVTFSACETARAGGRDATGQELESLGAKAQNQGAQAVLATLWKVDDTSTAAFMQRFYDRRGGPRLNKAEALRAVQLAMLEGRLRPDGRGDWSAPFHWAPFVLMGNWR